MIGLRFAVIFLAALLVAVGVGALTVADGSSLAAAVIAGGAAFAGAFLFLDKVIGD
ncbi:MULTISPECIES: hypothetical protein [unclassified Streptomyces]|uniref:hypothetical protein n=1 Tax=unclassified Streptomyces TaxID=2593676 RepID=UPI002E2BB7A8|nr:hypothetical protein [Streptomyces sp. NBC_01423]WSX89050.1 hypothetical protein OH827_00160 [Streptomyces sp. NBC_00891]WSY03529.1 hypothetical protein OG464_00160 [Streptomyces sp. NBC_00890]WSZ05156.1 hypothetical protein OG704_00160 [Streptomyces sp. NBC_00869]WSZ27349.1 hypothetical protein OG498_33405 [Streptomyces sp. NBC_00870]